MSRSMPSYQLITDRTTNTFVSEAYKSLRTNLEFSTRDEKVQTIMITSTQETEGKSTIAANLSVAFALTNKKVLLIDADMRGSSQHEIFNTPNDKGISNLLSHQCQLKEATMSTLLGSLNLIPAGPIPPNPSEILASYEMSALLEELKESYDVIIIDTPPILSFTDSQIIAAQCDGVLLVANTGKVKKEALFKAKVSLELVKARILGVVLNNSELKKADKKRKSYK